MAVDFQDKNANPSIVHAFIGTALLQKWIVLQQRFGTLGVPGPLFFFKLCQLI